jgi:hypothetical protein
MNTNTIARQFMNGRNSRKWHEAIKMRKQIAPSGRFVNERWPKSLSIDSNEKQIILIGKMFGCRLTHLRSR